MIGRSILAVSAERWAQLDLVQRLVRLEPGEAKNDGSRTQILLAPELFEVLSIRKTIRDQYSPECVWHFSAYGKKIRDLRTDQEERLVHADGTAERIFQDLRPTGIPNLIRADILERLEMTSGHKTWVSSVDTTSPGNSIWEGRLVDSAGM